jgi:hypothetical protein
VSKTQNHFDLHRHLGQLVPQHDVDLARHFKTMPTETVAFCFGIPGNPIDTVSTG